MEWEEYKQMRTIAMPRYFYKNKIDVKCPKCGEYIYRDDTIVLPTYPVQYKYFCKKCGWNGWNCTSY